MRFSANLGFLFTEYELPEAIRQAHLCGFAAVECHWPYDVPAEAVREALDETGLPLLSVNTRKGERGGLCAQADMRQAAKDSITEAFDYADITKARAVHVMAGVGQGSEANAAFYDNLLFACERAQSDNRLVLIEALNRFDAPGYFLNDNDQAADIIHEIAHPNLRLMFDCYHIARSGGDIRSAFHTHKDIIGHIQFAGTPHRGAPDTGDTDYQPLLGEMAKAGWHMPFGAEYKADGSTKDSLGWMTSWQDSP